VSAKPFVTITYTLPKAPKLSGSVAGHWKTFIDGIAAHERVHGKMIREMVDELIATTVGLTVANDPKCQKIRKEIETPLIAARDAYRAKSRDFDKAEMSEGGNVQRLILGLVNGQ
jgi:predicted secreted Zn-dependent protease